MSKKRKKKNVNYYFAEKEEQAVIDYINTDSAELKNKIYNEILIEPFRIMTESILRRYPIHIGNYDIEEVEANALSHLIENMVRFDPNKITKSGNKPRAYSYCQTIIRNFYIDHSKKSYLELKTNLCFEDYVDSLNQNSEYIYEMDSEQHYLENLINSVTDKIENILNETDTLKENEYIVGDAIVNILRNWNQLFIEETPEGKFNKKLTNKFAKNKILFFLKEQTGLTTKEIRLSMKKYKEIYTILRKDYFSD